MSQTKKALTIGVPAYNEEGRIESTLVELYGVAQENLDAFEIIVVDDGSSDETYSVAEAVAKRLGPEIRLIRQAVNQGVGAAFKVFLEKATMPYICLVPGDNVFKREGIQRLFSRVGQSPLIVTYREQTKKRTKLRFLLSKVATFYFNILVGKRVRDAHSLYVFPVDETRMLHVTNTGYGYHMETLSRLILKVKTFEEISVELNPKPDESSGVMKPKVLFALGITMLKLIGLRLIGRL